MVNDQRRGMDMYMLRAAAEGGRRIDHNGSLGLVIISDAES
jgi:hypothetical protein